MNSHDKSRSIEVRGSQIALRTIAAACGSDRNLLLIHGNPGKYDDWSELAPRLTSCGNVVAFDLPGFGKSATRSEPGALSLNSLADISVALADAAGFDGCFLVVGHSHGGGVAQTIAARHPSRVSGIVLISTLGYPAHWSYRLLATKLAQRVLTACSRMSPMKRGRRLVRGLLAANMKPIFHPEAPPPALVDAQLEVLEGRPEILSHMAELATHAPCEQLKRQLSEIACPTLFLHGAAERLVPVRCARNLHDELRALGKDSVFATIAGGGHMIPIFQAAELESEISTWLTAKSIA